MINIKKMTEGKVKWYDETKGFGFIVTENNDDIFVHRTSLDSPYAGLNEGDAVSFEITEGEKGFVAKKVRNI
jgi:CspA family cold shock protein